MSSDSEQSEYEMYNSLTATSRRIAQEIEQSKSINCQLSPSSSPTQSNNLNNVSKPQSRSSYQSRRLTPIIITDSHLNNPEDDESDGDLMTTPIRTATQEVKHQIDSNSPSPSTPSPTTNLSQSRPPTVSILTRSSPPPTCALPPTPEHKRISTLEKKITKETEESLELPINESNLMNPRPTPNGNPSIITPRKSLIPNPSVSRARVRLASIGIGIRPKTAPLQPNTAASQINKPSTTTSTNRISKLPTATHPIRSLNQAETSALKEGKLKHKSSLQQIINSSTSSNDISNHNNSVNRTIPLKKSVCDLVAKFDKDHKPKLSDQKSINQLNERIRKRSLIGYGSSVGGGSIQGIENVENEELIKVLEKTKKTNHSPSPSTSTARASTSSRTSDRWIEENQLHSPSPSHYDQNHQESLTNCINQSNQQQQPLSTNHSFITNSNQSSNHHHHHHHSNLIQNQTNPQSSETHHSFSMAISSPPHQSNSTQSQQPQQPQPSQSQPSQSSSLLNTSSHQQTNPNSNNNSNRAVRPRRSAASLHSIPERRSKEVDQPPLPVPPTPWVEPATPMLNPPIRQASSSTSVSEKSPHHSSFNIHPSHLLSPNDSNPDTDFIPLDSPLPWSTQDTSFPTTPPATTNPPGLRDQRLLSRYRATSQSLSTRHSEGSQYATSSSVWTPSSVAGSRLGFDSVDHGARTSVASRDSRFTAETDYEDYCPKVLPHPTSSASARSIHLAMSASWHGQQPEHLFNRPSSSPFTAQAVPLAPNPASEHLQRPTIASLMNVEEQSEMVGLGITSDEVVSVSRNSRSPSLTGRLPDSWRPSTQNLTPSNKLSAPTSNPHTNTSSSSFNTLSSSGLDSPRSRSATPIMEPPSSTPLSNISIKTHSLGLAVNPPQSVTSPSTSEGNSLSRAPSLHQKQLDLEQDQSNSGSGFNDPTDASKAHFYQRHHQAHWDDLDDGSPILASSAVIPSRAVVLAEEGGRIIDFSSMKCQLEDLHVPDDTTHLLITKTQGPFILNSLLTSCLPRLTSTLVVLDISDSYLASLPSAIASCTALEELNISGNICASGDLPAWIAHLVSLKVLAADRCGLIHLVNPLGSLLHVHHLSLRSNHLKSLPSWLCHLHALEVLLVDDNEFEPPWLELAEPLLSSNYRSNESEATLPTASSASETGSLSSSLAHGLQTTRSAPGEPTNSSHLATNNGSSTTDSPGFHGRISRPTTGASDYPRASQTGSLRLSPGQNERRLEGVESLNRRNSSVRRLRSSNELRSTAARPSSYHDHSPSLASFMEAEDPHQPGSGPASVYSHPQVQSQLDVHHSLRSAPLGPMERLNASASILERFPSKGIPQGVNFPPPQPPQSRDHKKSFGFLKKMSLGKLRREVTTGRERTNTLEARGGAAVPLTVYEIEPPTRPHANPLIESPKSVSEDAVMLMSFREPLAIPTRPAMPATQSADGRGWGSHNADREAAKNRRRSFLKLEPCVGIKKFEPLPMIPTTWTHSMSDAEGMVEDLMLATSINQDQNVNHHRASSESPSSQQHRELPSPVLSTVALSQAPHTNRSSTIDPRTGLRSIMMYLRDVHDLSGEPAAPVGVNARPGLVSRASSTKQPSSKSVNHPDFQSLNGRMYSMAGMNAMGSTLEIDSELDNSHSTSIHQSQTCSPVLPSTNSVPNETRPKVTDNPGRRLKVIEEIISTEKSYIRGLRELQDIYIASATAMSTGGIGNNKESTVPSSERKVVFNNVEAIIGFHVEVLLPDLQEVVDRLSKKQLTILAPNEIRSIAVIKKRKEQEAKSALDKTANPRLSGGEDSTTPSTIEENEEMFLERQRNEINGELIKAAAEDLAKVFIRHAAFLKLYSTYITQFDLALERLREWTVTVSHPPTITNNGLSAGASSSSSSWAPGLNAPAGMPLTTNQKKKLKTYLKRCRANPSHSQMNLESYLLMPVQRLPRYKLLLENLQSCTPDRQIPPEPTSSSIEDPSVIMGLLPNQMVSEALSLISAVTAEMNERKRDSEGRQRLLYWQQRFGNKFRSPLVQPHRTLIKEGRVTLMRTVKLTTKDVVSSTGQNIKVRVSALSTDSQAVTMILLLCTDLLVLAKDPGDGGSGPASSPASLHQALRLAQHTRNSLTLPATVFGAEQTMVRFVDSKAIFYFQCDSQRIASEWTVAVNQQVPLL